MKAENGLKKCSKCGEVKGVEEYGISKHNFDGLNNYCKNCWRGIAATYRNNNRSKTRLASKKYRIQHPEKRKEYLQINKKKIYQQQRDYRLTNRDKINENARNRRDKNIERYREVERRSRNSSAHKLSDSYIVRTMTRVFNKRSIIYLSPILIDVKRELIKTKRFFGQTSHSYQ